jgi:preprotein translocase subunit SecG
MLIYKLIWAVHFIDAFLLIVVVLLQTGKGSEVGFAFGSGAAQTMFGSSGGKKFITKFTIFLAVLFMTTSITLALIQAKKIGGYKGVMKSVKEKPAAEASALPGTEKPVNAEPKAEDKPVIPVPK